MSKRILDLPSDDIRDILELRDVDSWSDSTLGSNDDTIPLLDAPSTSASVGVGLLPSCRGRVPSSSSDESSESESENDLLPTQHIDWDVRGCRRTRFPATYQTGIQGELLNKKEPDEIFEHFIDDELCELIAEQTNLYAQQSIQASTGADKLKRRSRERDWVPTNKDEIKLLLGIFFLQGIIQKPKLSHYFSRNKLLATPVFYETMCEIRFFLLLKYLHFADNEAYDRQISPKLYKVKPVLDILVTKFKTSYLPDDRLSIDESLLLWKGRLGWKMYIPKKKARFGMESFKLCEANQSMCGISCGTQSRKPNW